VENKRWRPFIETRYGKRVSQPADNIAKKFQRLPRCFQDPETQWGTCEYCKHNGIHANIVKCTGKREVKDGGNKPAVEVENVTSPEVGQCSHEPYRFPTSQKLGVADGISCDRMQVEMYAFAYLLPVNSGHVICNSPGRQTASPLF